MTGAGIQALSWTAVGVGLAGTWIAGRHRAGWLVGIASAVLWIGVDSHFHLWAGVFAALLGVAFAVRNYRVQRPAGDVLPWLIRRRQARRGLGQVEQYLASHGKGRR